ncbi:FAD-binding oxidoreductase [Ectothiorhodospira lacustris]|uniref:FAD-binding oxidoreductase n=1 Tax=Ectothiorhodospira lacustris TaxID=2899127 RepID=UPI001EE82174|nr:FAD-linked oxidase C-terminal domain-containing protein [Ectothiorhodospira lacustris]MCG5501406.1 FAD-binding protein [Ectothiorhodospira lacustris]MCG5509962.1 FAD-binding protein [Ectothiorhodospira lacustris]MCG5521216.1 FAD-binding protein [Ectothiorhodospira lacustris]
MALPHTKPSETPLPAALLKALEAAVGMNNLLIHAADRWPYGGDNSRLHAQPQAVVFATETEQVQAVVRSCRAHGTPLIARGRGTGTTGATVPDQGGVVLSLERMDRILELDPDNRLAVVQPGVTNQALQEAAGRHGFFWPPDPTSAAYCTIGGNLAYNSAGPRAVKYGTPRDNTLGLTAVTGRGQLLRTGVYTTKGVVGYDLTRLLIGSEGTLGVITEAILKLTPLPEGKRTLQAVYASMDAAAQAVSRIMAQPVVPCALEFMDGRAIEMIRHYSRADLPEGAGGLLMIEVDGLAESLDGAARRVMEAARGEGCLSVELAGTEAEIKALWSTRKALSPALRTIAPKKINEDVVVPVSKIPALVNGLERLGAEHGITIVSFGHAGNGNIHVNLLVDPDDAAQMKAADACLDGVFDLVLGLRGSISGEHGIGLVKRPFVARELGEEALALMHEVRRCFDPDGILNPGKGLPPAPATIV